MAGYLKVLTTADVAEILELREWRVIKFVEGKEYGIKPAFATGKGRRSRRLYDVENVCEIAVALRLLETGLRSRVIGQVIRQLRERKKGGGKEEEKLSTKLKIGEQEAANLHLTIMREPRPGKRLDTDRLEFVGFTEGLVETQQWLDDIGEEVGDNIVCDMIFVPIGSLFLELRNRLGKFESEEEKE